MAVEEDTRGQDAPPNADLIAGLRDAADWLELHPELPRANWAWASISFGHGITTMNARERLTQFAAALGDRAKEHVTDYGGGKTVTIDGRFGPLVVSAEAKAAALVQAPPIPAHEPILPVEYGDDRLDVFA